MDNLKVLKRVISEIKSKVKLDTPVSQLDKENYIAIIESLDKQIPKKIYFEELDNTLECPTCSENLQIWAKDNCEDDPKYCPNCGQKLIWD